MCGRVRTSLLPVLGLHLFATARCSQVCICQAIVADVTGPEAPSPKLRHVVSKLCNSAGESGQDGLDNGCLWSSSIVQGTGSVEESWREKGRGVWRSPGWCRPGTWNCRLCRAFWHVPTSQIRRSVTAAILSPSSGWQCVQRPLSARSSTSCWLRGSCRRRP